MEWLSLCKDGTLISINIVSLSRGRWVDHQGVECCKKPKLKHQYLLYVFANNYQAKSQSPMEARWLSIQHGCQWTLCTFIFMMRAMISQLKYSQMECHVAPHDSLYVCIGGNIFCLLRKYYLDGNHLAFEVEYVMIGFKSKMWRYISIPARRFWKANMLVRVGPCIKQLIIKSQHYASHW